VKRRSELGETLAVKATENLYVRLFDLGGFKFSEGN
jgi:hypothetical protein